MADGIDVCFSSSNKCLHSVAGVSFLCVSPRVWPRIARQRRRAATTWTWPATGGRCEELGQTPFTPAVSAFFALETALDELAEQGGVPARRELYRRRNLRIRRVLTSPGLPVVHQHRARVGHHLDREGARPASTVQALYDRLKERGFVIYKAKGPLAADHIQIANMGEIPDATLDAFLAALTDVVEDNAGRAGA